MARALFLAAFAACSATPPAPAPTLADRRDEARLVLERHCGHCHIGTEPTARAGALAVFDLTDLEWAARMTPEALTALVDRVDDTELVPEDEREAVRRYVSALQASSMASP